MTTEQTIKQLEQLAETLDGTHFCGVRGLYSDEAQAGEIRNSRVWEDGNVTDERLGGTCAVALGEIGDVWGIDFDAVKLESAIREARSYGDGQLAIIVGDNAQGGEDAGEWIISNARILLML